MKQCQILVCVAHIQVRMAAISLHMRTKCDS